MISALVANTPEADSLPARRARAIHRENRARDMCQWFQIRHCGRSESPLPDELPPDGRERVYGPIGLGR